VSRGSIILGDVPEHTTVVAGPVSHKTNWFVPLSANAAPGTLLLSWISRGSIPKCDHPQLRMPRVVLENAEGSGIEH
jgi:hypothetical protein